jgi:polar amino acid transport system substrate-binding protein
MTRCLKSGLWAVGTLLVSLSLVACGGSSGTQSSSSAGGSAASGGVAVPAGALLRAGQITYCSDISAPPLEFLDASQKPVGAEVELGDALAKAMGLKPIWANTAFNGIIPALQAKQCDAVLSQLFIKPEREAVVDFVPYMHSANTLMVKASTTGVTGLDSLCGKKAAVQTGTTFAGYLKDASAKCTGAGKPAIDVRLFTKDSDALQQLKIGLVDAYGTTLETAGYVMKQQPGEFALAGEAFGHIKCGIATRKDATGLRDALTAALQAIQADGTYDTILKNWNLSGDALKAS